VREGERRHATILFSDLSGYTAMNETLDPEEVERIMRHVKEEAVRIVEEHGGIVNQFVGDEVLALFGIPTAHEDDPRRAVQAALALHELVRGVSPEVEGRIGRPLRMHSGINTGLIVTNLVDARNGTYGITGDTVNTGARLKAMAEDDHVLLSPDTRRLVEPYFRLEALPPAELRGKQGALIPYRVTGASGARSRLEVSEQRGFTRFTGRERELAALQACLEKAEDGQGQFVTVAGEAGVGKSRLLYEFRAGLERERITVLQGHCQPSGSNTPFLPHIAALRRGLRLDGEEAAQGLAETVEENVLAVDPALERYLPFYLHLLSLPGGRHALPESLQGEELRRDIQLALAALLAASAAHRPVMLLLEDWQWADEASDAVLHYLIGVVASLPLLLLVTHRPEHEENWGHVSHHTRLGLNPLDEQESEAVIKAALKADLLPEGLPARVHERTAGNPFFIEEVCAALLEQGAVEVRERREAVLTQSLETLTLPDSVHAVIRSRLDRLEPDLREVLQLAAVVGREFSGRVLERLLPDAPDLFGCLERLKALELIRQVRLLPEPEFAFRQVVTQEVTYETLLLQRRKALHLKAAEAIEALFPERLAEFQESLAHHYGKAEAWKEATPNFFGAAQTAKAHYAYRNAVALCTQGLAAATLGDATDEERVRGLVLLGDLRSLMGELEPANKRYQQALAFTDSPEGRQFIENKVHRTGITHRDGAKLVYYEHGTGKHTLCIIRPMTYGIEHFQPGVEQLCQEFRIVTMDARGAGESDPITRPYLISQHMEDVRAVIEAVGAGPVTAVGISRAGNLMTLLAVTYPDLLERMVLVSPAIPLLDYEGFVPSRKRHPEVMGALEAGDLERAFQIFLPTIISEPGTEELRRQGLELFRSLPEETIYSFFLDREEDQQVYKRLGDIRVPTLVMHGTEDLRIPFDYSRVIVGRIPGALLYPFEGRCHAPNMTATGEFCDVLRQFVLEGKVSEPAKGREAPSTAEAGG
jgi:class 3 adenylate cyclase/pimeloyl-ACP methyl ester carboxylesterase